MGGEGGGLRYVAGDRTREDDGLVASAQVEPPAYVPPSLITAPVAVDAAPGERGACARVAVLDARSLSAWYRLPLVGNPDVPPVRELFVSPGRPRTPPVVSYATPFPAAEERLGAKVKAVPGRWRYNMTKALPSLPPSAGSI